MSFLSKLFETPWERQAREDRESQARIKKIYEDVARQGFPEFSAKCKEYSKLFPIGYKYIASQNSREETPIKEMQIAQSWVEMVRYEISCLVPHYEVDKYLMECRDFHMKYDVLKARGTIDGLCKRVREENWLKSQENSNSWSFVSFPLKPKTIEDYLKLSEAPIEKELRLIKEEDNKKWAEEQNRAEDQRRQAEEQKRKLEEKRRAEQQLIADQKRREQYKEGNVQRENSQICNLLSENAIYYFYHFTSRKNIASIRRNGGLYSWQYLKSHNIYIPVQGGGELSQGLDQYNGLADYVHLSFCKDHPMAYRHIQNGEDIIVLKISTDVATLEGTKFSDMNAVDSRSRCSLGLRGLSQVNFEATKEKYLRNDDPLFKYKQAEILVKTHVPLKYILNIDEF